MLKTMPATPLKFTIFPVFKPILMPKRVFLPILIKIYFIQRKIKSWPFKVKFFEELVFRVFMINFPDIFCIRDTINRIEEVFLLIMILRLIYHFLSLSLFLLIFIFLLTRIIFGPMTFLLLSTIFSLFMMP